MEKFLIRHLSAIEAEKNELIEKYYNDPSPEKKEVIELLEGYIHSIEKLLHGGVAGSACPFVMVGSQVEVQDLDSGEVLDLRLVNPFQGEPSKGEIYYISPMGRALLLKKLGEEVEVKAPGGIFRYKIIGLKGPS
ncbi:MAG TPA: GreA/GreB family elongation factor [Moorella mulderi]|nr:GreA/GreB family elongation factor [Moorella mulderi]